MCFILSQKRYGSVSLVLQECRKQIVYSSAVSDVLEIVSVY